MNTLLLFGAVLLFGGWQTAAAQSPPATPANLAASAGDAQATLRWNNPNDSSITRYQVRYGAGSTVPASATWGDITGSGAGTTSHKVTGLTNFTAHAFEIRAVNAHGNSDASAVVTATPLLAAPDAPGNFTVTPGDGKVTLNWELPDNTSEIDKVAVRYHEKNSSNQATTVELATNATTYEVGGLTNGTLYTFVVEVENRAGSSQVAQDARPALAVPAAPTGLTATAGNTTVTLTWDDPSDTSITKYRLRYGAGSTVPASATWGDISGSDDQTTTHMVTGLTNGTQYAFEIRAVNAGGNSDASATATATPAAPPQARSLTYTFTDDGSTITITASGSLDLSAFTYDPFDNVAGAQSLLLNDRNIWSVEPPGFNAARRYNNVNLVTTGSDSYTGTSNLSLAGRNYSTDLHVRLSAGSTYLRLDAGRFNSQHVYQVTNATATFTGTLLDTLGDNDFHVEHAFGIQKIIFKATPPKPAAPTGLAATADSGKVTLNWTDPSNNTISKYQLRYGQGATVPDSAAWGDIAGSGAATTRHEVTGLTNGTQYAFEIRAVNSGGESDASGTVTATPVSAVPSFGTQTIADQRYGQGTAIATLTLPEATGGDVPLTYSLTPNAPSGLAFDATNRTLTGTPNTVQSATAYTYTVTDADGDTASLAFNITIAQARTLTYTFSDDGSTVTIAASGSLDATSFNFVQNDVPSDTTNIRMDDTDIWGIHPHNSISIRRYNALPDFVTTGEGSYGGTNELSNMVNYSSNYHVRFSTFYKLLQLDSANFTGDIYQITNGAATFDGTLQSSLGDNDFDIEFAMGNQKIVFQTANPATVPAAPTGLAVTAGDAQVDLAWTNPNDSNITKYQVRHGAGSTVPATATWADIDSSGAGTTSHTVAGLTNATGYAFEIRAVNARGNSSASGTVTATPALAVPAAPTEFSATAGNAQASLSWTLPTNASEIGDVQLRWKATADLPFNDATDTWTGLSDGTATSYIATGLTNGTGYTFEVRATNTAGNGAAATATATPAVPPATATGLAATAGDTTVTLNWTDPNDSSITTYQLRSGAGATVPATATWGDIAGSGAGTTSHMVTGLTNGTQYAFEIRAVNAGGPGPASEQVVMRPGPPLQPSGFRVVGGNAQVTLSWDDPPSDTTLTRYQLRHKVGTSFSDSDNWSDIANSGPTTTTHNVTGLTNGATWAFQIRAVNAAGAGPASETLTMLPRANNRAPVLRGTVFRNYGEVLGSRYRNVRLTKGFSPRFSDPDGDDLTFTWTANPEQTNLDVQIVTGFSDEYPDAHYLRFRSTGPVERTTMTVTGTDPYGLSVSTSAVVTTSNTTPKAKSPPYPDQTLAVGNTLTVNLTDMFVDDEGDNLHLFLRSPDDGDNIDTRAIDSGAAIRVIAHTPGEEVFSVTVRDIFGAEGSDSFKVTVIAAAAAPAGLTATSGNGQAVLTWTDPGDSGITKYQLRYKAGTSFSDGDDSLWADIAGSGASTTSHTVTGLTNGTEYVFQVRAVNAGGTGPASEVVLRLGAPLQPGGFRVVGGNGEVTLSWSDPSDATITRYQLRRKEGTSFSPSDDSLWTDIANSGAATTTHTVSGLTNGTTWAFQIRAVNAAGAGPASETLTMLPRANNRAPVFRGTVFGSDGVVLPSRYRSTRLTKGFSPSFSDPDGDELTFTWTANPPQANLDVRFEEPGFSEANPDSQYLSYRATGPVERTTLTVTGTDPYGLSVSTSAVVTTSNTAPKAKSPPYPDQTLAVGNTLTVNLTDMFVDDEGDDIRSQLRSPSNGNSINTWSIDSGFDVIAHTPGEDVIRVTVADLFGAEGSDSFKVTVIAAAAAPAGFTATSGDTQAVLAWTDPGDSGITKYQSRHKAGTSFSDGDDGLWTDIDGSVASTTSHTVTELTNGTEYVFQVRAVNAGGPGTASDPATATPVADLMPDFGTATVADQSYVQNTQITTLNLPQATGGDGTLTYSLSPDAPDGLAFDAANRTLSGTPTTGQATTAYTYTATDADGDTASLTFDITVLALPDAPTGLTSLGTGAKVTLSWTNPGDATITKYQVRHAAAAFVPEETIWTDITGSGAGTTRHDVTGLTNGTRYAFEIRAVNAAGAGTAATIRGTPVMARTLTYTFSDDGATVTIAASGSVDLRGFDFTETSGIVPGGQQSIKIDATESDASNIWAIHPPNDITVRTYASLPSFVTTGRGSYEGSSSLSQLMGYSANFHIRFETSDNFLQLDAANLSGYIYEISDGVATFTGTLDGLLDDDFRVEHTVGNQKIVFTTAAPGTLPSAPTGLAAAAGDTQVELTWSDPGDTSITKYQVRHGEGQTVPSSATWADITGSGATTTTHTVMGLTNDKAYAFEIRAVNASGYSDASNTVSATPLAKPSTPVGLAAAAGNAKATLTWTDPGNDSITKYQLRYGAGSSVPTTATWADIPDSGATTVRHEVTGLTNGTEHAFQIRAVNASGEGAASAEVTAMPSNTPPTAADNTITTDEDTAYTFDAADFNFSDADTGDTLASVKFTGLETAGALQLSGADVTLDQMVTAADIDADNLTFTPAANANGDPYATFQFSVNDGTDDSTSSYTMTIDVTAVNDAPTVANAIGARSVAAGSNLTVALETDGSEVFNDVDGDTLTYSATSATETAATVTVDNDADTITLNGVAVGTSEITVTAADGNGGTVNDTFTLTVTAAPATNKPPTAADNTVTTDEDTAYTFDAADFNFSDTDTGATLASVKITGLETAGALQLSGADVTQDQVVTAADIDADNLTFTPAANANGDPYASFRFSVNDGDSDSTASYTMTIDVTAVNDVPTVANAIGARTVAAGSNLTVALETDGSEVFNDVDGDTLTYSATSATETAATVTVDNDANTITLSGVAAGSSEITVTAADGNGGTVNDTFTLTVTAAPPTNTPPTASDNTVTTDEDTAYTFDAADFNFSDVDSGDTLSSVKITGLETAGALQLSGADVTQDQVITAADIDADNLTFTPAANANGDPYATFQFSVNDGTDDSTASYTMTIDVTPVNDAPTVANAIGARTVAAGSNLTVALETSGSEVFNDVDGDTLTYSATSATETAATVTVDNDANTITLNGVAAGTSVITVTAADGNGGSVSDTFTLTVTSDPGPTNTPPTASDDTVTTDEDTAYTFDAADFNFSDADTGDTLASVKITGLETAGALQLSGADVTQGQVITAADIDGDNLTFTPAANANGDPYATFRFSVNDGEADSTASYTMTIDVAAVNDAPTVTNAIPDQTAIVASAFSYAFPADTFADVDNDTLTYTAQQSDGAALPTWLSFTAATRTFTGTPQTADEGTLSVQVTANDGNNGQVSDTFDITVLGTPNAPTNLTAAAGDTRVTLSWNNPNDSSITRYQLRYGAGATVPDSATWADIAGSGATTTTHTVTGLTNGTQYAFEIRAVNGAGNSDASSTPTATPAASGSGSGPVDRTPTFNNRAIADQTHKQNVSIDDLTLPSARSGDGSLSYTLSPDLPAGLSFDAATRRISGTPTEALAQTEYTYTATDRDGDTATLTFNITVEAEVVDLMPSFGDETIADQDFTQNTAIDTLTLPLATGGDGALSYSIEPALPAGLMLDEDTRTISGTPTVAQAAASYTWTATDVDGDTASLSFNIRVAAVLTLSGVADADTAENTEYSAAATLEGTPVGDVNWSLSGADAALFSLSNESNDGVTVSLPAQDFENAADADADNTYEYTLTATDADGNGVGVEVAVRVTDEADTATVPSAPAAPTLEAGDQRIAVTWSAPADDGGSAITGYTVQWKAGDGAWPEPGPMDSVELGASSTSFNIDGLSNGTTYEVRVLASNAVGDGAWSDAARATPMAVTDASRLYRDLNEAILPRLGQTILDGSITAVRNRLDLVGQPLPAQQSSFVANLGSYRFNNSAESIGAGGLHAEGQYGRLSGPLGAGGTLSNAGLPGRESMQAGGVSEPGFGGRGVGGGFASVGMNGTNGAGGMASSSGMTAMSSSGGGMSGVLGGMGMSSMGGGMGGMDNMNSGMNGRGSAGGMGATDVLRSMLSRTLGNSAFSLQQGTAAGNTWGFWGAGSYDNLSGSGAGLSWDGDLYGARLGADMQIQDYLLLGLALQYSQGAFDWNGTASGSGLSHGGQYDIKMPGIHPYIGWVSSDRAWQLWAMAGYDEGQIEIHEQGGLTARQESDVDMLSLAGGIGRELWSAGSVSGGGQYSLRGRAEVAGLQMDLAGNQAIGSSFTGAMESMTLSSHRLRAGLEASHARVVGNGNMLDLSLEAGLRSDGDDSQDDTAVELGIGIGWRGTNGLTLDGRARVLTASDIDSEEWGVDLQLHFDPGQPNVGMNLDVSTVYGAADMLNIGAPAQGGMGGAAGIFGAAANMGQLGYSQWHRPQLRFESNMGYGFETRSGLLTPYWGMAASGAEERHYRVGARWEISYSARLLLEVQQDGSDRIEFSSPNGDRTPRSRIMLEFHVSF
ncbi:fibronectin type III domain-containing protein [Candidatus Foliamicus sp.]